MRVLAVLAHAHGERLDPAQHEPAVERARHGAERLLQEAQALRDASGRSSPRSRRRRRSGRRGTSSSSGRRRRRRARAAAGGTASRTCCRRRGARRPRARPRPPLRMSTMFSSGFDGVSIQTSRVRSSRCVAEVRRSRLPAGSRSRSPSARRPARSSGRRRRRRRRSATTRSPGLSRCMIVVVAPSPDEKATPCSARLERGEARSASAVRVGFATRE